MPHVRKTKQRPSISKRAKIIAGICAVLAIALAFTGLYVQGQEREREVAEQVAAFTPAPVQRLTPEAERDPIVVGDFDAAATKLRDTVEPFTLTVVGDSTGFPAQGWVEASLRVIGEQTGRTYSIRTWNNDTGAYGPARVFGEGEPDLIVWNGSAPGKDAGYSLDNIAGLIPEPSDILVINHGHNVAAPDTLDRLIREAATTTGPDRAVAIVKQNPQTGPTARRQEQNTQRVASIAEVNPGIALIDAHTAVPPALVLPDGIHPTDEGYQAWADAFLTRLGF